ncbi:phage tail sheath family protein [Floridanema aerugineum]|uniref:Phage tail sheath family protein n=1 Tax=Floridaenema aerugineum BLCC-F46 TaxID=3153654 RepID=A0ABV4WY12_9CYAN
MPEYLAPGVYVEEIPSAIKAIAGVSTSVAGFIGVVPEDLNLPLTPVVNQEIGKGDGNKIQFTLGNYKVKTEPNSYQFSVGGEDTTATATLSFDDAKRISLVTFTAPPAENAVINGSYQPLFLPVAVGAVKLCTNFSEFKKFFGDFSTNTDQRLLVHAVYGFFNNGGSRCYVMRVNQAADITVEFLERTFEPIDEIAIVAAPGIVQANVRDAIIIHCRQKTQDRFAIFDSPETVESDGNLDLTKLSRSNTANVLPNNSDYAAFYFPWIEVFDPATKTNIYVPPSGHLAGIYARVDTAIGVHKAPANEVILGALGLKYNISKAQQQGLNPQGVNCIRNLNGNFLVWGARTIAEDTKQDLKYINVRRTLLYLRESIDEGTQWVVFEPNTPDLWKRIIRNVSDFLTVVWRSGALFGNTPQEAFYVKCDAEKNPPEERELGRVITEIGVAIVRPAEFVIFRISQITANTSS